MLTQEEIRGLAGFDPAGLPVTTFYLNVDRARHTTLHAIEVAHQLVREASSGLKQAAISERGRQSVAADLDAFTRFCGAELAETEARGVVAFACSGAGLWKVFPLPVPVTSTVKVRRHAMLRTLVGLLDDIAPYSVVLVDREKARFFHVELGGITELEPLEDDVDGRVKPSSYYGLNDKRIERHVDEQIAQHLKRVAAELSRISEWRGATRIVVGGTPDVVPDLLRHLPATLLERVAGVMSDLTIIAGRNQVLSQSLRVNADAERMEESGIVAAILEGRGPHGHGAVGVASTLAAIYAGAVHLLAVDDDLAIAGYRCVECQRLFTAAGACPECGGNSERFDDLIEEAMRQAICKNAQMEVVSDQTARNRLCGMGALLHFPIDRPAASDGARAVTSDRQREAAR